MTLPEVIAFLETMAQEYGPLPAYALRTAARRLQARA